MNKTLVFIILFGLYFSQALSQETNAKSHGVNTVVIDAGHGGKDPGNLGTKRYKTKEKDIALKVALLLGKYIEENLSDVKVVYTRKTDVFIELEKRADIANKAKADLFISIHCDAFNKKSVMGTTSIVMGLNHQDDNLRVALRENSVIEMEDNYEERYEGFDPNDPSSYIAFTLYQSEYLEQSVSMAQKVQNQFRQRVNRRDRGVKQQPLMVTKMAIMPAVLIELGFLTNHDEEDFLNSEQGQAYMASAIYRAFKEYKIEREAFEVKLNAPVKIEEDKTKEAITISPAKNIELNGATSSNAETAEVYLSVQILTSSKKKELQSSNFNGLENVWFYQDRNMYKYVVGKELSLADAEAIKKKAKESGYSDAFIIGLANGKRVTVAEAIKLLE